MDPQRRLLTAACLGGVAVTALASDASAQAGAASVKTSPGNPLPAPSGDGRHDFDFFHGSWHLHNRRLKHWLADSDEWVEFEGRLHCQSLLDGIGNIDEVVVDFGEGIHGISLRLYDPATRLWSDYWATKRSGVLTPPVVSAFTDGIGTFHGEDRFEGRPVRLRAIWTQPSADEVRWEQAFSADQGKTWETNWTMRMTRQA
ncbi:MAG: hypothetical protein ABWZ08_08870 [Pseudoxanthomonas sp.]